MKLKMTVDFCCGGGHCGPIPGYDFECPKCKKFSGCRTGEALEKGDVFKCAYCEDKFEVQQVLEDSYFMVEPVES